MVGFESAWYMGTVNYNKFYSEAIWLTIYKVKISTGPVGLGIDVL